MSYWELRASNTDKSGYRKCKDLQSNRWTLLLKSPHERLSQGKHCVPERLNQLEAKASSKLAHLRLCVGGSPFRDVLSRADRDLSCLGINVSSQAEFTAWFPSEAIMFRTGPCQTLTSNFTPLTYLRQILLSGCSLENMQPILCSIATLNVTMQDYRREVGLSLQKESRFLDQMSLQDWFCLRHARLHQQKTWEMDCASACVFSLNTINTRALQEEGQVRFEKWSSMSDEFGAWM